jgi:hypothetical protein
MWMIITSMEVSLVAAQVNIMGQVSAISKEVGDQYA